MDRDVELRALMMRLPAQTSRLQFHHPFGANKRVDFQWENERKRKGKGEGGWQCSLDLQLSRSR